MTDRTFKTIVVLAVASAALSLVSVAVSAVRTRITDSNLPDGYVSQCGPIGPCLILKIVGEGRGGVCRAWRD